jgi:hypothetical protein
VVDQAFRLVSGRVPQFKLVLWNPNRTTMRDVVLGEETSPRYDLTPYVIQFDELENAIFENSDEDVATTMGVTLQYDPTAMPIPISERTLVDGAPVRLYSGDARANEDEWVPIFTGVIRGSPSVIARSRAETPQSTIAINCVGREEGFLATVVIAHSYEQGTDIGRAAVETAVQFMGLDRREVNIGDLGYTIGHPQSQIVDVEILKGIYEILFAVGKKPKFDNEGFLIACDTDIAKPPARVYQEPDMIVEVLREPAESAVNNSVKVVGLSNDLTEVVENRKKLANGTITSGFFETEVRQQVWFSENRGKDGSRRAKNTTLSSHVSTIGDIFGESVSWQPTLEDDGVSVFGGKVVLDTGYDPTVRIILISTWAVAKTVQLIAGLNTSGTGLQTAAAAASFDAAAPGLEVASEGNFLAAAGEIVATAAMIGMMLSMTEMGRVEWELKGDPFQYVYQEICATAQLANVLSADIREIQFKNDWIYALNVAEDRALDLLKRELIKSQSHTITMLDDPLLDVDDVVTIENASYYVTSIRRRWSRTGPPDGRITVGAWRVPLVS